jgi:hypothetical protein
MSKKEEGALSNYVKAAGSYYGSFLDSMAGLVGLYQYTPSGYKRKRKALRSFRKMPTYGKRKRYYRKKRSYSKKRRRKSTYRRGAKRRCISRSVRSQLRTLKKAVESDMATLVYKRIAAAQVSSAVAGVNYGTYEANNKTKIESVLAKVYEYDTTTGNMSTVDFTAGTAMKEIQFTGVYSKVVVRNNYLKPARVSLYVVAPKGETSVLPMTAISNGLTDMSNATSADPMIYPSDSPQFRDLWKIKVRKDFYLTTGKSAVLSWSTKGFQYDPSFADSHNLEYQPRWKGHCYLIRVEGVPSSGTGGTGLSDAQVDCIFETHYKLKYPGGADFERLELSDNQTITAAASVASMDVEKNTTL